MYTLLLIRTALRALEQHKIRSFLTILGIMIGVAAIMVTLAIGKGAEKKVKEQIMALGEGAMFIVPGNVIERGRIRSNAAKPARLTVKDLEAIQNQLSGITGISRGHEDLAEMQYETQTVRDQVSGMDANIMHIMNLRIAQGSFFTDIQVKTECPLWFLAQN